MNLKERDMNPRIASFLCAVSMALATQAAVWRNLDGEHHIYGPKISQESLAGKVVLVDNWGVNCPPCRASLPRIQNLWKSFKHKPFVLIGSHCQVRDDERAVALLKDAGCTYPVYQNASIENPPEFSGIPFLYVVDAMGNVVYSGHSEQEATEALVEAITDIPLPGSLTPGVNNFGKYQMFRSQVQMGKNVEPFLKRLDADIAASEAKPSDKAAAAKAQDAKSLKEAIGRAHDFLVASAEMEMDSDPPAFLRDVMWLTQTWPSEKAEFASRFGSKYKQYKDDPAHRKAAKALIEKAKKAK